MKREDDLLARLFQGAAHAPSADVFPLPLGFEARVLAGLRAGMADDSLWLLGLFRRAMFTACVVTLACLMASYAWLPETGGNEITFADSLLKHSLLP